MLAKMVSLALNPFLYNSQNFGSISLCYQLTISQFKLKIHVYAYKIPSRVLVKAKCQYSVEKPPNAVLLLQIIIHALNIHVPLILFISVNKPSKGEVT